MAPSPKTASTTTGLTPAGNPLLHHVHSSSIVAIVHHNTTTALDRTYAFGKTKSTMIQP